jgi:hypothetical protein
MPLQLLYGSSHISGGSGFWPSQLQQQQQRQQQQQQQHLKILLMVKLHLEHPPQHCQMHTVQQSSEEAR